MEVEAVDEGKLGKILIAEGTEGVAVNTPIAVLIGEGEDTATAGNARSRRQRDAERRSAEGEGRGRSEADLRSHRPRPDGRTAAPATKTKCSTKTDQADRARSAARRHGGRDARATTRSSSLARKSRSTRAPTRLARACCRNSARPPRHRHPHYRARLYRPRRRRRVDGPEADRRVHDLQLRHAGDRPHHQLRRQDAVHVRRPDGLPDRVPRAERCRVARRRPALARNIQAGTPMCRV